MTHQFDIGALDQKSQFLNTIDEYCIELQLFVKKTYTGLIKDEQFAALLLKRDTIYCVYLF